MSLRSHATGTLSSVAGVARGAVEAVRDEAAGRRVFARGDRAYVEAKGLHDADVPRAYVDGLEARLTAAEGVHWAAVNGVLGDVIVAFDRDRIDADRLRELVTEVERAHGMTERPRDRPIHPSDFEQVFDRILELAGDLLGAGVGLIGRLAPALGLPAEAMALPAAADLLPSALRRRIDDRFGAIRVELALSLFGAVMSAASRTPLSTVVDGVLRAVEMPEALAARWAWEKRARELAADYATAKADPLPSPGPRPVRMPEGAGERYARRAKVATAVATGATLLGGGVRAAAGAVLTGAPKAAAMGADAFAAELGRVLARRGAVVRDPSPLRCLDRVDTVVIDESAVTTGRMALGEVRTSARGRIAERTRLRLTQLFNPNRPATVIRDGHWRLGPLADLDVPVPAEIATAVRGLRRRHDAVVGLARDRQLVAVAGLRSETDPLLETVVTAAHRLGRVVVAPARRPLVELAGADGSVAGASRLASSVRALQAEGRVVAVIAGANEPALVAADCGIGVIRAGRPSPWAAHVLAGPGLADAWLLLRAAELARSAARRSASLALLGAVTGLLSSLTTPDGEPGRRAALPANVAALASILASVWSVRRLAGRPITVAGPATPWHAMTVADTMREVRATADGLTDREAHSRTGPGEPDDEPESMLTATAAELRNPLTAPLAVGAGLSAISGSFVDAALVAGVMAGNALFGAAQKVVASRAVRNLSATTAVRARVRRDGREQPTPAANLVVGDVVLVQPGDVVCADCRLFESNELEVDESSLTGESTLVSKDPAPIDAAAVADRRSMLYAGTTIAAGTGTAVVVSTGRETEAGRSIAGATDHAPAGVESTLARLTSASLPVAAGAAGFLLAIGQLRGRLRESVPPAVALAVAAVPEGLPFTSTAAQFAAARRLSRRGVLVRTPRTLEALGRVDVVCFDKTGTLTQGTITLAAVSDGAVEQPIAALSARHRLALAVALRASPLENGPEQLPHPTDRAVNQGGAAALVDRAEGEPGWRAIRELPFEPGRGFHAVLGRSDHGSVISVKGAPETVLPRCTAVRRGTAVHPLSRAERRRLDRHAAELARRGYRVLAVAERSATSRRELGSDRVDRLEFIGFLGLADPIRPTAAQAVEQLRRAGVDVVMLTGDHPNTASSVGAELGLLNDRSPLTGPELDRIDEPALARLATGSTVFARVTPAHKVAIVRALRSAGRVVAVTGDGANDAAAMRLADAGIAVGARSTEAARAAADIVITDERIETIVDAVIESRAMWRSVRDSVALLVGGNLGEILFTTGSAVVSKRPALNARQVLLVNLFTDLLPALVVASRPPRHVTPEALLNEGPEAAVGDLLVEEVIRRALATALATTGGWLGARATGSEARASTVALASLVGAQLAQTATAARGDPVVLAAVAASAAMLVVILQSPPLSAFFGCRPLGPVGGGIAVAASLGGAALGARAAALPKLASTVLDALRRPGE